jgi:hypothetical protein
MTVKGATVAYAAPGPRQAGNTRGEGARLRRESVAAAPAGENPAGVCGTRLVAATTAAAAGPLASAAGLRPEPIPQGL